MAIITMPITLKTPPDCGLGRAYFNTANSSAASGADQVRIQAPPSWTFHLTQPKYLTRPEAGVWLAMLGALRGRINVLAAFDPSWPLPSGTLRGVPTLSAAAAAGATTVVLTGCPAGATLLVGDKIQVGTGVGTSDLCMVAADATATAGGVMAVSLVDPLLWSYASGVAVTTEYPRAYMRKTSASHSWQHDHNGLTVVGLSADFVETFSA